MTADAASTSDPINLGPKSRAWLAEMGIHTLAQLRATGAVPAYVALKASRRGVSLNLLYALVGAADGLDWRKVKRTRRLELLLQLDDCQRSAAVAPPRRRRSPGG